MWKLRWYGSAINWFLKEDISWRWTNIHANAFRAVKESLHHAPILALPKPKYPLSVVCDAFDFTVGSSLLQTDAEGRERGVAFKFRLLKAAEKIYPVNDKRYLLWSILSSNFEFTCLAPSQSSSKRIIRHYARQHSLLISLIEWLFGFSSLRNIPSR